MGSVDMSVNCSRVRAQVSLQLDDELSQLERRMVSAHLERCHDCSLYAEEVEEFTLALRAAPMVSLDRAIAVTRPRRLSILRMQAGVAAVLAVVAVGLASQVTPSSSSDATETEWSVTVTRFPTAVETQRELEMLRRLPNRAAKSVMASRPL
jgi:predicted anti-sigma-YlaC factor YlaD